MTFVIGLPGFVGGYAAPSAATGVPAIMCEPMLLDVRHTPMRIDASVRGMEIAPPTPMLRDIRPTPQRLNVYVRPMKLDCDT